MCVYKYTYLHITYLCMHIYYHKFRWMNINIYIYTYQCIYVRECLPLDVCIFLKSTYILYACLHMYRGSAPSQKHQRWMEEENHRYLLIIGLQYAQVFPIIALQKYDLGCNNPGKWASTKHAIILVVTVTSLGFASQIWIISIFPCLKCLKKHTCLDRFKQIWIQIRFIFNPCFVQTWDSSLIQMAHIIVVLGSYFFWDYFQVRSIVGSKVVHITFIVDSHETHWDSY